MPALEIGDVPLFDGFPAGRAVLDAVAATVGDLDGVTTRVSRTQVAFRRRRGFAYVWRPGQHLRSGVPAVLSIALPRKIASSRVKEVAHPSPHVWMHHLEMHRPDQVDDEVAGWLTEAWEAAA